MDALEEGAKKILRENGVSYKTVVVPGAFEIPFMIKSIDDHTPYGKISAYIAFATVIQGDTPHFDYVCQGITNGISQLNITLDVPTIFGVLTVLTEEQAFERIGGKHGHKGEEAAITAIKMIELNQKLRS